MINFSFFPLILSTFSRRCARNVNAMGCRDLARLRHVGCDCQTSALSAIHSKTDLMERRGFKSATVCETTTRIRSREATEETRTSLRIPTTSGKPTRCTESGKITRNRIGELELDCKLVPKSNQNLFSSPQVQVLTEALQPRSQAPNTERPRVLWTIPRILREKSATGNSWHARSSVQRHIDRCWRLRFDVLRSRLSNTRGNCRRALRVHLPLVLRSQVQDVSNEEDHPHVSLKIPRIFTMIYFDKKLAFKVTLITLVNCKFEFHL